MGSTHKLVPAVAEVFTGIGGRTALDAFSGSGVVAYALTALGSSVTANDVLVFASVIARAAVVNQKELLTGEEIEEICGEDADDRDVIQQTFRGLCLTDEDRRFLDSAWSHIDRMSGHKGTWRSRLSCSAPPAGSHAACSPSPASATTTAAVTCA